MVQLPDPNAPQTGAQTPAGPAQQPAPHAAPALPSAPQVPPAPQGWNPGQVTFTAPPQRRNFAGTGWYYLPGPVPKESLPDGWDTQPNHFLSFWQNLSGKQMGAIAGVFGGALILLCCGLAGLKGLIDS